MRASTMWLTTNNPTPTPMCGAGGFDNNILVNTHQTRKQVSPHPTHAWGTGADRFSVVIAWGKRPVPSRTRKLRPTALMVLHSGECGRVRHRRNQRTSRGAPVHTGAPLTRLTRAHHTNTHKHQPRNPTTCRYLPFLGQVLRFSHGVHDLSDELFPSELGVEGFDETVLPG